jgi:diaminobutyrate-2-oxoglutarate transaminase
MTGQEAMPDTFARLESEVRSYCRNFPTTFSTAHGATLEDEGGRQYIDFLSGAGTLNYGHNNPTLKRSLVDYVMADGIVHGLDLATAAKRAFLETFEDVILRPRGLPYKVQFTGPTGANAVEAAFKIARKMTGRHTIVAFTHAFHGVTLGALAATAGSHYRRAGRGMTGGVSFLPYDGYLGPGVDTTEYLDRLIEDKGSGLDHPAAVVVETVQGEGGVNVAGHEWLRSLERVCRRRRILLIVDDIQAGCGRTGPFFSFEDAGLVPDIVTLSKSLSGYGLPFAVVLLKPELDGWRPGEHNGTFRGHNLAFVTARAALEEYWRDGRLTGEVRRKGGLIRAALAEAIADDPTGACSVRGRGMMQGLDCRTGALASRICELAFQRGLVIETSGPEGQVVKCLCPLTIPFAQLDEGLTILKGAITEALAEAGSRIASAAGIDR